MKARSEERREGPSRAETEDDQVGAPASGDSGAVHFLTLRCGPRTYVVRLPKSGATLSESELQPGPITVRFEGKKAFLRPHLGTEREGSYVEIPSSAAKPDAAKAPKEKNPAK